MDYQHIANQLLSLADQLGKESNRRRDKMGEELLNKTWMEVGTAMSFLEWARELHHIARLLSCVPALDEEVDSYEHAIPSAKHRLS